MPGVVHPSSIQWNPLPMVMQNTSIYTGQTQTYNLMNSYWKGTISFPIMSRDRYSADAWQSFILACQGMANCFMLGDPTAILPKGAALGAPLVAGAGQTGYSLVTRGWVSNYTNILMAGDYIQIGSLSTLGSGYAPRLYRLTANASSDNVGDATLSIFPNLRDLPPDGAQIYTRNCVGLMALAQNDNSYSSNPGSYGVNALPFREAI